MTIALAVLKAVSLTYLLGAVALTCATVLWRQMRWRTAPSTRADAGFFILAGTTMLALALGAVVLVGVTTGRIHMTAPYCYHLMHYLMRGSGATAILLAGLAVLGASAVFARHAWWRARIPRSGVEAKWQGWRLRLTEQVCTASLVGLSRVELWVNPAYWASLTDRQRSLAVHHELAHARRLDNARKLFLGFLSGLYYALPWMRWWARDYELDCELSVDDHCRRTMDAGEYRELVGRAVGFLLEGGMVPVRSSLSHADLAYRLRMLHGPLTERRRAGALMVGAVACVLSVAPVAALLLHPASRCFLACFLGF